MTHKWIEVSVRLIGEDYKQTVDCYTQRINYEYFQQVKPLMVAEIAAIVNDLPIPQTRMAVPMSPQDIGEAFDKEYSLYKDREDNP